MKINSQTKISEIIAADQRSIDVIASINSHFRKLKNPILRKLLAKRVTVREAAKIGKVSVEEFLSRLSKLNFETEVEEVKEDEENHSALDIVSDFTLDVRPVLSAGDDPLKIIMQNVKKLKDGETMLLVNTFEPIPLIKKLNKKGFQCRTHSEGPDLVHTYITKHAGAETEKKDVLKDKNDISFEEISSSYKLREIDVRGLEMPGPMVKILEESKNLNNNEALYVHHKKIPQFLFPELEERNLGWSLRQEEPDEVKIIIFRK